jgi:hypothetical protein
MVTLVKHEWHSVDSQFAVELDIDLLQEIYPDKDEDELQSILDAVEDGSYDIDELIEHAWDNDVEIMWERQYDDWYSDRKGGYEVTYELGDEDSWHSEPEPPAPTHKCTKCRWKGSKYETKTEFYNEDGSIYTDDELEFHHTKEVCPMCDSALELTPDGIEQEAKMQKLYQELDEIEVDESEDEDITNLENELDALRNAVDDDEGESYQRIHPAGEYTIRIFARTTEFGIGTITKEQYEHWRQDEYYYDLGAAINEEYDFDENSTPEEARFTSSGYYEFNDVAEFYGMEEDADVEIINSDGETIFEGEFSEIFEIGHNNEDSQYECSTEVDEIYPHIYGKGYYLIYKQGGKGGSYQHTLTVTDELDFAKFRIDTVDVDGTTHIKTIYYDNVALEDEGIDEEYNNWRGQWADYSLHEVK